MVKYDSTIVHVSISCKTLHSAYVNCNYVWFVSCPFRMTDPASAPGRSHLTYVHVCTCSVSG